MKHEGKKPNDKTYPPVRLAAEGLLLVLTGRCDSDLVAVDVGRLGRYRRELALLTSLFERITVNNNRGTCLAFLETHVQDEVEVFTIITRHQYLSKSFEAFRLATILAVDYCSEAVVRPCLKDHEPTLENNRTILKHLKDRVQVIQLLDHGDHKLFAI